MREAAHIVAVALFLFVVMAYGACDDSHGIYWKYDGVEHTFVWGAKK